MPMRALLLFLLCSAVSANALADGGRTRIVLVGDSTVTDSAGWGLGFKAWLGDGMECVNMAQGGRSSKSFMAEGHWARALELEGDFYLIQFGHNDEPGKGSERETDPGSSYVEYMSRYVDDARAIGAKPILVTSLTRRTFDPDRPGAIKSTLTPYVEAVKKLAAEKGVPLVDLHARSIALCEELGPEKTAGFDSVRDGKPDTTHLDARGSAVFARVVVEELHRVAPELAALLRPEPTPPPAPAADGK